MIVFGVEADETVRVSIRVLTSHLVSKGCRQCELFLVKRKGTDSAVFLGGYPLGSHRSFLSVHSGTYSVFEWGAQSVAPFFQDECPKVEDTTVTFCSKLPIDEAHSKTCCNFVLHGSGGLFLVLTVVGRYAEAASFFTPSAQAEIQMLLIQAGSTIFRNVNILRSVDTLGLGKRLTNREQEILTWSSLGKTYDETAEIVGITKRTVKFHMANIVEKLGAANAKHAISIAHQAGIPCNVARHLDDGQQRVRQGFPQSL